MAPTTCKNALSWLSLRSDDKLVNLVAELVVRAGLITFADVCFVLAAAPRTVAALVVLAADFLVAALALAALDFVVLAFVVLVFALDDFLVVAIPPLYHEVLNYVSI